MLSTCRAMIRPLAACALRLLPACALALVVLFFAPRAEAYAWMIKHGYSNCGACHSDPSGGELLTVYGRAMSEAFLSSKWGGGEDEAEESEEEARRERRRIRRAIAQAAGAKFARAKKESKKDEEEESSEEEESDEEESSDEESSEEASADEEEEAESDEEESAPARPFSDPFFGLFGLPDSLLLGGSVRLASTYKPDAEAEPFRFFPMQIDLYGEWRLSSAFRFGGSFGLISVRPGSPHGRAAQITTNQTEGMNLVSRTHWVGFDFGGGNHSIRAGRLNLPFGIRMSEHVMWVRERTETDRESDQQHGVALAMNFEKLRFEVMGILGNYQMNPDEYRERGYAGYIELMTGDRSALGVNSLFTTANADRFLVEKKKTVRQAHGLFMRAGLGERLALMAEFDFITRSRQKLGYAGFLQLDYEPAQGLHLIGTVENANTGFPSNPVIPSLPGLPEEQQKRLPGTGKNAMGYWISAQWFFVSHFDFRIDAILRQREPLQILSQLHVYL
ncbi:MAG TPA: hypothetical protein VKY73_17010 [Polyangiaceae bacterium]|nr:hypothetical protein [Polyangiaceae bacterium]